MRHRSLLRYDRRRKAMLFGFIVWLILGGVMVIFGIYAMHSKRAVPFGFWANAEVFEVNDVRAYNRAVGRLWCVFGAVFILLGFPFLTGQNSPYFIVSILGCMIEAIVAMVVYVAVIEKKYRVR
jgi:hypothetical protein